MGNKKQIIATKIVIGLNVLLYGALLYWSVAVIVESLNPYSSVFFLFISAISIASSILGGLTFLVLRWKVGAFAARLWTFSATFLAPFLAFYAAHLLDWGNLVDRPYSWKIIPAAFFIPFIISIFAAKR